MSAKRVAKVKSILKSTIRSVCSKKQMFVKDPKRDFTRERKLPLCKLLELLLCMEGRTLSGELLNYFKYDPEVASSSAFVQQRNKLNSNIFPYMLQMFAEKTDKILHIRGIGCWQQMARISMLPQIHWILLPIFLVPMGRLLIICSIWMHCMTFYKSPIWMPKLSEKRSPAKRRRFAKWWIVLPFNMLFCLRIAVMSLIISWHIFRREDGSFSSEPRSFIRMVLPPGSFCLIQPPLMLRCLYP